MIAIDIRGPGQQLYFTVTSRASPLTQNHLYRRRRSISSVSYPDRTSLATDSTTEVITPAVRRNRCRKRKSDEFATTVTCHTMIHEQLLPVSCFLPRFTFDGGIAWTLARWQRSTTTRWMRTIRANAKSRRLRSLPKMPTTAMRYNILSVNRFIYPLTTFHVAAL